MKFLTSILNALGGAARLPLGPPSLGKGALHLEELRLVEMLAQQVVAAVEQTARISGEEKKRLALQLLTELLREQGLRPPLLLLDVVLEAAVRLLKPKSQPAK